jgi:WD40 repeat protein
VGLGFTADGKKVITASEDSTIKATDLANVKNPQTLAKIPVLDNFQISKNAQFAFGQKDNELIVWDLANWQIIKKWQTYTKNLSDWNINAQGDKVITIGDTGKIYVWDWQKLEIIAQAKGNKNTGALAFHPDNDKFICATFNVSFYFDFIKDQIINQMSAHTDWVYKHTFSEDGKLLITISADASAIIWETQTGKILKKLEGSIAEIKSLTFSPDNKNILLNLSTRKGADYDEKNKNFSWQWEVSTLRQSPLKNEASFNWMKYAPDNQYIIAYKDSTLWFWDKTSQQAEKKLGYHKSIMHTCFSRQGNLLATANESYSGAEIKIWDLAKAELKHTLRGHASQVINMQFNVDGTKLVSSGGFDHSVRVWDIEQGKSLLIVNNDTLNTPIPEKIDLVDVLKNFDKTDFSTTGVSFSPDGQKIINVGWDKTVKFWNLNSGKREKMFKAHQLLIYDLALSPDNQYFITTSLDNTLKIWQADTWQEIRKIGPYPFNTQTIYISPNSQFIYGICGDNALRVWRIPSGELILTMLFFRNGQDYLFFNPNGEYMASKNGTQAVHFYQNEKVYLFDQFDLQFNRPDLLLKKLGLATPELIETYQKAYEKRLKKQGFQSNQFEKNQSFNVPQLHIKLPLDFAITTQSPDYQLNIIASDEKYKLNRLNVWVNGVPIFGAKGKDLKGNKSKKLETIIPLKLSFGKNFIEASVLNEKGVESLKEHFELEYNSSNIDEILGKLYLITINVGKFQDPKMNLSYAVKDGQDISKAFASQSDKYMEIITENLFNELVTLENIQKLKQKLAKTTVNDVVMIFVSSHGLLNKNLDYYLATSDIDFKNPEKRGLKYEELEKLLDGIPARQKVLMLDACHSGEVDKEENLVIKNNDNSLGIKGIIKTKGFKGEENKESEKTTDEDDLNVEGISNGGVGLPNSFELMKELFADLRRSSGATVISAAGGAEYALEGADWNNGVFTYAILSGLKEKKADLNKDGNIMLSELKTYVQKVVPDLTGGRQQPTSRTENLVNDFRVW